MRRNEAEWEWKRKGVYGGPRAADNWLTVTAVAAEGSTGTWSITVQPDGADDIIIALPAEAACVQPGAECTADGQRLHNFTYISQK